MSAEKKRKEKRGVSLMIGYVLLISMAVILSVVAYQLMKTYIPKDIGECPDDVSMLIQKTTCSGGKITFEMSNNGLFNIDGIYIEATTTLNEEIINLADPDEIFAFNEFKPNDIREEYFGCPASETCPITISVVEITPVRYQENDQGAKTLVNCGKAKLKETINCQLN
ncbi:MAG: hypothetical protein Q7R52_00480 [archaeon]|nr:hypothetical protein [archaeon]